MSDPIEHSVDKKIDAPIVMVLVPKALLLQCYTEISAIASLVKAFSPGESIEGTKTLLNQLETYILR